MRVIYKYRLAVTDTQTISMPAGAKLLTVQVQSGNSAQGDHPYLWALVETVAPLEDRTFITVGTGHPVSDDSLNYLGTYQLHDGRLVFHVFELVAKQGLLR